MNSCFITVYENNSKGHMFYVHDSSKESEASLALQASHQLPKAASVRVLVKFITLKKWVFVQKNEEIVMRIIFSFYAFHNVSIIKLLSKS